MGVMSLQWRKENVCWALTSTLTDETKGTPTQSQTSSTETQREKTSQYGQCSDGLSFIILPNKHSSDYAVFMKIVIISISENIYVCVFMFTFPQHLHIGVTSCPSAELLVPSKHSVIDAAANQDNDHTAELLEPTSAQIPMGGSLRVAFLYSFHYLFIPN